jgi:hypothetical protein
MKLGKKSFLHIGTGVDIQPKKHSRKITGMLAVAEYHFIHYQGIACQTYKM